MQAKAFVEFCVKFSLKYYVHFHIYAILTKRHANIIKKHNLVYKTVVIFYYAVLLKNDFHFSICIFV